MIVQRCRLVGVGKAQAARHAQMHDLGDRPKIEQQILAASGDSLEPPPRQPGFQIAGYRPAQVRIPHDDVLERTPLQAWQ